MNLELSDDQHTVLRLCCEAASPEDVPYWESWFSPKAVLSRYATRENRREADLVLVLQSLIIQGYFLLPPAERPGGPEELMTSLPSACQVTGLGFEKYAQARFERYLDWVEEVSAIVSSSEVVSSGAIAEQLGIDPVVFGHILQYHELL